MGQIESNAELLGYAAAHVFVDACSQVCGDCISAIRARRFGHLRAGLAPAAYSVVWCGIRQAGHTMSSLAALSHIKAHQSIEQVDQTDSEAPFYSMAMRAPMALPKREERSTAL